MQTRFRWFGFSFLLGTALLCGWESVAGAGAPTPPVLVAPPVAPPSAPEPAAVHAMAEVDEPRHEAEARLRELQYTHYMVGGKPSEPNAWPFAASFIYEDSGVFIHYCGGSLIARDWVLTAAHCSPAKGDIVLVGRHDLTKQGGNWTRIESVVRHPDYDAASGANDIALVRIGAPAGDGLPTVSFGSPPAAGQSVTGIGWGAIGEGEATSAVLRQVDVPVWGTVRCQESYADTSRSITQDVICAAEAGKDACDGDSGGPLLDSSSGQVVQVGIVSYGVGCANPAFPGVYTRVDRYLNWIQEYV